MLSRLSLRAVGTGNQQDSAVHLSSTGDHVFNIVSVSGAVNVSVVSGGSLILNVCGVDRYTSGLLFGSLVDLIVGLDLDLIVGHSQNLGDSSRQCGLTVVNVTDGTDIYVRLCSFKLLLCHFVFLLKEMTLKSAYDNHTLFLLLAQAFFICAVI
jgi:hypothetical protein